MEILEKITSPQERGSYFCLPGVTETVLVFFLPFWGEPT